MGRPRKIKTPEKNPETRNPENEGVGVPGLFAPQERDIQEEVQGMDSYLEHCRERQPEY